MMQELVIKIGVTLEQAQAFAQMEALVLFMSPEQKNFMRASIGGLHDYTKKVKKSVATLEQVLETSGTTEPHIAETLAMLREPSREAVDLMHSLRILLGGAMFAQPGADGETLQ